MKFFTRYHRPPVSAGRINFVGELSKTQQQFKDECDLNLMALRFGGLPAPAPGAPIATYGDFASLPEFHQAQDLLIRAREQFAALPSRVRDRFKNDPSQLLAFVADPANLEEAHELGLLSAEASARVTSARAAKAAAAPTTTTDKAS